MDWPARSPDLNPIEHVWDFLGRRLAARTLPPLTILELRLALQDEWTAMPQQLIDTLILSMGRRFLGVPRGHIIDLGIPRRHIVLGIPRRLLIVLWTPRRHLIVLGIPRRHLIVLGIPRRHLIVLRVPQVEEVKTTVQDLQEGEGRITCPLRTSTGRNHKALSQGLLERNRQRQSFDDVTKGGKAFLHAFAL
ncbi:transposable element Tcb2 transposase [Trichonephila clavipes]|nr:transposable element Tcb2 transposase [Trichonephila clavipes]